MFLHSLHLTFFLQFFPDLIKRGHVFILDTPLFRIRNNKKTIYAYNDLEKTLAIKEIGASSEITRFKGLGEISPNEFKLFIGENIKLVPVLSSGNIPIQDTLEYYMGKNTQERQNFIINNLKLEENLV